MHQEKKDLTLQNFASFCKKTGFIYPSSEIYGGMSAIYDYGHYGILLKENIKNAWWKSMVQLRDDVIGLDSAIFMHPTTWKASGHVDNFNDPQIDCKKCKNRFRADHLLEKFGIDADKMPIDDINKHLKQLRVEKKLKCEMCGSDQFTDAKPFMMTVKSNLGSPTDALSEATVTYLRPETCGGIYLQYKNIIDTMHPQLPFGVAQVGKAFRNEIVARQFIFRTREFEQMEMQYFHDPKDTKTKYEEWKKTRWQWYLDYGIPENKIHWLKHKKLAFYASAAFDIEYNFRCLNGFKEMEGIHARTNYDLTQHAKFSGVDLDYLDPKTNKRFVPHIMETSVGLNRLVMMFLDNAYTEEKITSANGKEETRIVLKLDKKLAPIKVAVFPLLKNKPELVAKAKEIYKSLRNDMMCEFDDHGNIGKRYRRQDEIGTPYCITVDFDSLKDNTVTLRDRDTMKQERVKINDLNENIKF